MGASRYLLLAGSIVISLLFGELAVRLFDLGPEIAVVSSENLQLSTNPVLQYELKPHSADRKLAINSDGMRDREYALAKPPGTVRVAVIGDSIAFGYKVARQEAFPEVLERLLNRHFARNGIGFEVLNFGVVGYSVPEIVESLPAKALKYDPDVVIYGYCLNDPERYNPFARQLRAQLGRGERSYLDSLAAGRSRLYALARWAAGSLRHRELTEKEREAIWTDDPGFQAWRSGTYEDYLLGMYAAEGPWKLVTDGFDRLGALSRREGIPTLVAVFPLLRGLGSYRLGSVHEQLAEALRRRSLGVLDLTGVFVATASDLQNNRGMSVDMVHPKPRGHGVAALAILHRLLEDSLVPGAGVDDFSRLLGDLPEARAVHRSLTAAPRQAAG